MPRPESTVAQRRSARATTRASTTSSGSQTNQPESAANQPEGERVGPPRPDPPAIQTRNGNQLEAATAVFTANQVRSVENIVKASITEAMSELKELLKQQCQKAPIPATSVPVEQPQQPQAASSSVSPPNPIPLSQAPTTLPELMAFERLGATPFATQSDTSTSSFSVDGGFTPEIPQAFVRAIQSGEFFDISKLLPENLQKITSDVGDDPLAITIDGNSQLKLIKQSTKKKIETIDDWTNAFTVYMKVVIDKYPARSRELLEYLDLIRYAARYHHSLGWFIYDNKFRYKAANDRSLSWAKLDQQLWTRIFTVSQSQLEADLALFKQGPSSVSRAVISAPRDGTCNNYNKGNPCVRIPCIYRHTCNKPGCNEPHPGYSCPKQGGKYPSSSSASRAAAQNSNSTT